jgi:tRNA pseudouridine55 synthase
MSGSGILLVDKPAGPTSHDAVARARRALGVRRIGHFGTLDPFATGLLVLGVGAATRLATHCADHGKTYRATVRLGARSSTDDPEGRIEPVADAAPPDRGRVEAAAARWVGTRPQVPPAYSAKHVGGTRAYARARAGEAVTLPPVDVSIHRIEVLSTRWPDLEIEVACGRGTYVRALARDLGEDLGTGGYCLALRRTRSGPFRVEDAARWDDLADPARARAALRPAEEAVSDLPAVRLDLERARAAGQGRAVPVDDAPADAGRVRIAGPAGFIGLGELRSSPDGGVWLQPRTVLFPAGDGAGVESAAAEGSA